MLVSAPTTELAPKPLAPPVGTTVAYFCMEIGLSEPHLPTYAGGLGVLAGDTLRTAADLGVPMVGVSLLYRGGYFRQELDASGRQIEHAAEWRPEDHLRPADPTVTVEIGGRPIAVRAWRFTVLGIEGDTVPVYLLDTDLDANAPEDRLITDRLYPTDPRHRLRQQALLGLGGVEMLRALGHNRIGVYHMNEGHSALLTLALIPSPEPGADGRPIDSQDVEAVRHHCVFTTHTPVAAAMDRYPVSMVNEVLGPRWVRVLDGSGGLNAGELNMTDLALRMSRFINGVAMHHSEVSRGLFPRFPINSITNGVHAANWVGPDMAAAFDRHVPEWRADNLYLRYAVGIPLDEIDLAHDSAKRRLLEAVYRRSGLALSHGSFTIGMARRATAYKRLDLLFSDVERLRGIVDHAGPLQVVVAGKAHPADSGGKSVIERVYRAAAALRDKVIVAYLPDYDIELTRLIVAGSDLWLNTPRRPYEASGTSGMKAALNGVPSLSVLDGWWVEGHIEGVTGWSLGTGDGVPRSEEAAELVDLYGKLERVILPMYYERPHDYTAVCRSTIAVNGSFFNSQRMLRQYVSNAYRLHVAMPIEAPYEAREVSS